MKTIKLLVAGISLVLALPLYGQGRLPRVVEGEDKTLSPYFQVDSDRPELERLPLKSSRAEINIAGVIAAVKVNQVYKNEGRGVIEAVYVFPLSTRAAVHAMRLKIGERIIEADVREKSQARDDYEQARAAGKSAALLEQHRPNVFQMNVANILPGDEILVALEYTELIIPELGMYEFVYPAVVGPRYTNAEGLLADKDNRWLSNPYTGEGEKPSYQFSLKTVLQTAVPITEIRCLSHETDIQYESASKARIGFKQETPDQGNRDFILQYRLSGQELASGLLLHEGKEENFFLAMIQPPRAVKPAQVPPREYVFIVDVSGSMHGFPLDISKKLLRDLIGKLRPIDHFNVQLFAGASQFFSESPVVATAENISQAIAFIDKQRGGGGTELLPALKQALALNPGNDISRTFVIVTDGYVAVEKEAFDLIRSKLNQANFFAFGIGSSVNRYLIEGIARAGMGLPFVISKQENAEEMAARFRAYIASPVLTDIAVRYQGMEVYDVEPLSLPDVFSERPVLVFGKYRKMSPGASLTITGQGGAGKWQEQCLVAATGGAANPALTYLWAREKIRNLVDFNPGSIDPAGTLAKEITALGIQYKLLTPYTAFVAIDSEQRNTSGTTATVIQPLPLPEGVSRFATSAGSVSQCRESFSTVQAGNTGRKLAINKQVVSPSVQEESKLSAAPDAAETFAVAEEMPVFPGGSMALDEYLRKNIRYPARARANSTTGTVFVSFTVDANGNIKNAKVLKGIGDGCDEEALRLILGMPAWTPAKQAGKAVQAQMTLAVKFNR